MKGKISKTLAVVCACMCAPFALSGCDKEAESKVSFRVEDGYIQVTEDGTNWKNLVDIDDLKGEPGEPGEPGQNGTGINGKQVEFRSTKTHIQWRYVGDDQWVDLVSFEELRQDDDVVDVDAINQRGFELFASRLDNMNNDYKVTYEYDDKCIVESFGNYAFDVNFSEWSADRILIRASMEYSYDLEIDQVHKYTFNGVAQVTEGWVPSNMLLSSYEYEPETEGYNYFSSSGKVNYQSNSADENFNFNFVKYLKSFKVENIRNCEFNDNGDCVISFNYYGENAYSEATPYLKSDYIYKFNVTKDGDVVKCYIYEKDFLNPEFEEGDLYCEVTYEKGESLLDHDLLNDLLEKEQDKNSQITSWLDFFNFTNSNQ